MNEEGWGPWIDHDGKGCPVPLGTIVKVIHEDGISSEGPAEGSLCWVWGEIPSEDDTGWYVPIIKYRVKKPKGLIILESLLQNLDDKINIDQPLDIQT